MSYDPCKFCGQPAYKTNGKAELICVNRAETGDCNDSSWAKDLPHNCGGPPPQKKKPGNSICRHEKKIKHCKKCCNDPLAIEKSKA